MEKEFNLSEKIGEVIGSDGFRKPEVLEVKDVKEFIRICEDNSEEINGISYIKISEMQKFAGKELIK